ncbi:MAG: hypothetical protein KBE91_02635 [Bacteroidia bacterium]|nr:hypothetical protein [Bacteroidia bacterium]
MKNIIYKRKLNTDGTPFLDGNGDFVNEIVSEEEVEVTPLTIEEINQMQSDELKKTDWYFTRKIETGIEVPKEILEERSLIRKKYDALKNEQ